MPLYEHVFLARQDISNQQAEGLMQDFRKVIEEGGGTIGKTEYWGLKPIAYKIRKNRKAHYALMNIDAPHEAVAELERQMRLNSDIIRFMTIRVDEHEDGPSAMMRRSDRDDRDGRGGRGDRGDRRPRDREPQNREQTREPQTREPQAAERPSNTNQAEENS